jgi:hypothetical protein
MPGELLPIPAVVELLDDGVPVAGPEGMVYSSSPRSCTARDGNTYIVKGPGPEVAAEVVGYLLAEKLGIAVPSFAVLRRRSELLFGSRLLAVLRDPAPFIQKHVATIARVIVLDVWLWNDDRNLGGILIGSDGAVAIDFEKSWAVRSMHPLVELPTKDQKRLWPRGELGLKLKGAAIPNLFVNQVVEMADGQIEGVLAAAATVLPEYTWHDRTAHILKSRRNVLARLVKEIWQ